MTTDDHVTNKDLYQEIMKLHEKMDTIVVGRISPLERAVDRVYVYFAIIGAVVSVVVTVIASYIKERVLQI
jgi:hypothetical protein